MRGLLASDNHDAARNCRPTKGELMLDGKLAERNLKVVSQKT
jgi:hypothetical protein